MNKIYNSWVQNRDVQLKERKVSDVGFTQNQKTVKGKFACAFGCMLAFLMMVSVNLNAQVSNLVNPTYGYTFLNTTSTYTTLAGGTVFQSGTTLNTDAVSTAITLPNVFTFNGIKENRIFISNNGFITFGIAPTATQYSPISSTTSTTYNGVISGFGVNAVQSTNAGSAGEIRYGLNGSGDFVIQFKDLGQSASTGVRMTFQILLMADGKTVQIVYGPSNVGVSGAGQVQVGLRGTNDEDWNNRALSSGGNWNTAGGAAGTLSQALSCTATTTLPTSGRTFQWSATAYAPTYLATPFATTQDFTTWTNGSGPNNVPSTNWATNGYGNASWQIDNTAGTTTTSGWTSTGGAYSPVDFASAGGGRSARFHSFQSNVSQVGYLDYYVDLSGGLGALTLDFFSINPTGTDILQVFLSTDGGATFTQVGSNITSAAGWIVRSIPLGAVTSATSIIRFKGTADFGNDDIGIDNVKITQPAACPAPASLSATVGVTNATLNWSCISCTGTFRVEYNTAPATFGGVGNIVIDPATSGSAISGLTGSTNYTFFVRQDCGGSGFSTVSSANFTTAAPGENCTTAATIAVAANLGASVNTLLTTGLTSDGPNGTCSDVTGNPSKKDRWVKFVAPSSGNKVIITTSSGSISDAVMQVWSACPATGVALGCSDDVVGNMPQLEFCSLTGGATYYVQVWPYSASATGNFNIKIYEDIVCPVPPSNDECAGVETIIVGAAGSCPGAATSGTTVNATATPGVVKTTCDAFGTYNDVFYKFNSGANTSLNFNFTNLTGTNEFGLYTDCGITYGGICSSSSLSTTITGLTASTDYYIVVWANSAGAAGTFSICISTPPVPVCVASPTAPANGSSTVNPCAVTLSWPAVAGATSYDVYLDSGAGPATTLVSPAQAGTSYVAGLLTDTTAYSWRIVPKNGSGDAVGCSDFTFTTTGAPACTTLTAPADVSTICAGPTTFTWAAAAGATTYDVYLDTVLVSDNQTGTSYSQTVTAGAHAWSIVPSNCIGDATGCVDFTFTANGNPAGDTFATAIDLGIITATTSASGDNQTSNCWRNDYTSASTPGNASARPGNDVFYKFEITECGSLMDIGTCTSSFDTYINLLNAAGTRIGFDDDSCSTPNTSGSFLSTLALAPGVYYVVVEGYNAVDMGTYTLDLTYVAGTPQITYYQDSDTDGFGNSAVSLMACTPPVGYVTNSSDCDDTNIAIYQSALLYTDVDGDGYNIGSAVTCYGATLPAGTSLTTTASGDCNDNNNLVWQTGLFYVDADGDNYSPGVAATSLCYGATEPVGLSILNLGLDCDDNIAAINPGQAEILYNGVDDNCNGQLDEGFQITTTMQGCGTTLTAIGSLMAAVSLGAPITGYRFEVTRVGSMPSEVQVFTTGGTPNFSLTQLPLYAYASTYSIRVMLQRSGTWLGYYGAACNISSPAVLAPGGATSVTPSQCGITLPTISTLIATTSLAGVTGYKFKVTNQRTGFSQELTRTLHWFSLTMLTQYNYGDTYTVEVAVKTTGAFSGYGSPCDVTAPAVPSLTSQCSTIIPTKTTNIVTTSLALVTSYDFEVRNMTTLATANVSNNLNWFRLSMLTNYAQSTQYRVRVRVLSSGVYSDYGDACFITSPAIARTVETVVDSNVFEVTASPNPFDTNFGMFLNATSTEDVSIRVYDMIGKLIEQREVKANEVITQEVGNNYPSGVYNVIVSQGSEVKTLRVIKR